MIDRELEPDVDEVFDPSCLFEAFVLASENASGGTVRQDSIDELRTRDTYGGQGRGGEEGGVGVSVEEVEERDEEGEENPESEELLETKDVERTEGSPRKDALGELMGSKREDRRNIFLKEVKMLKELMGSSWSDSVSVLDWAKLRLHFPCNTNHK